MFFVFISGGLFQSHEVTYQWNYSGLILVIISHEYIFLLNW
jgi:hypothetical protein